ncbi:MAG: hypothetical protein ACE5H4_16140 [Candidatus Thorarchaeota archaeon]
MTVLTTWRAKLNPHVTKSDVQIPADAVGFMNMSIVSKQTR